MGEFEPGITAPPFHPNCRTTTVPYFEDDMGERIARGADGKTYYVPGDMTYREWENKFVKQAEPLTPDEKTATIKLTEQEERALNEYLSSGSYKINALLREKIPLEATDAAFVKNLDSAISKLPNYKGTVYRSLSDFGIGDIDEFVNHYRLQSEVEFPAYTSASVEIYDDSFPIQYVIECKFGKDLRKYNPQEAEILFSRNSKFSVTKVEGHTIYLEEI